MLPPALQLVSKVGRQADKNFNFGYLKKLYPAACECSLVVLNS